MIKKMGKVKKDKIMGNMNYVLLPDSSKWIEIGQVGSDDGGSCTFLLFVLADPPLSSVSATPSPNKSLHSWHVYIHQIVFPCPFFLIT